MPLPSNCMLFPICIVDGERSCSLFSFFFCDGFGGHMLIRKARKKDNQTIFERTHNVKRTGPELLFSQGTATTTTICQDLNLSNKVQRRNLVQSFEHQQRTHESMIDNITALGHTTC